MASVRKLSKKAREILKLVCDGKTLAQIIQEHPDLVEAMDEFNDWSAGQQIPTSQSHEEPPRLEYPLPKQLER